MPSSIHVRAGRPIALAVLLAASTAAQCASQSDCPLQIRQVYFSGRTPQVIVRNRSAQPIGRVGVSVV